MKNSHLDIELQNVLPRPTLLLQLQDVLSKPITQSNSETLMVTLAHRMQCY